MTVQNLIRLAGSVFLATSLIVLGDTAGKLLAGRGVAPPVIAMLRFGMGAIIVFPLCRPSRAEIWILADWRILLRGSAIAAGICCIVTALRTEPIANVYGAFFVGPAVSYVLSATFLKEQVSKVRSAFLAVGFIGVLLVVKPGFDLSVGMVFACAAGVFYGIYLTVTKAVAHAYRPTLVLLSQVVIGAIVLAPLGITAGFPHLDMSIATLLLVSALSSAGGNYLIVLVHKKADASLIAPLIYGQLIAATAMGVVVFGETPDGVSLLGLGLIFISGIGSLLARQVGRPGVLAVRSRHLVDRI